MGVVRGSASRFAPALPWMISVDGRMVSSQFTVHSSQFEVTNSGWDLFDALAAGRDHRLDELVIGVLIAAIDELRDGVEPVRTLVVNTREIERAQRVVRGADEEEPGESSAGALQRITQAGGFEREQLLGGPPSHG